MLVGKPEPGLQHALQGDVVFDRLNRVSACSAGVVRLQEWAGLVERIMEQDWSWSEPALDYIELYYKAIKG